MSNFAAKIGVEVYANQEKSLSAVKTLIKYVFSFEFSSWIINEFDKYNLVYFPLSCNFYVWKCNIKCVSLSFDCIKTFKSNQIRDIKTYKVLEVSSKAIIEKIYVWACTVAEKRAISA